MRKGTHKEALSYRGREDWSMTRQVCARAGVEDAFGLVCFRNAEEISDGGGGGFVPEVSG